MEFKAFVPPIKIHGIKTKLAGRILELVDSLGDVHGEDGLTWVEPFMGSGSVGFNMMPFHAVFGDVNPHVVEFHSLVGHGIGGDEVRQFLTDEGGRLRERGQEYYYEVRERFNSEPAGVRRSLDFLFLDHAGYNGVMRFNRSHGYNVPFSGDAERFTESRVELVAGRVAELARRMEGRDWTFACRTCAETLAATAGRRRLVYCDPPYVGRNMGYYGSWGPEEERGLCASLSSSGSPFVVSTWVRDRHGENPCIDGIWRPASSSIVELEHEYRVGAGCNGKSCGVTEVLIVGGA